jgi:uncharacterized protein (DUF58 family)
MRLAGILILGLLAAWAVVAAYRAQGVGPLRVRFQFDPDRIGPGERGHLVVRVDHLGRLPLAWVRVVIPLPRGLPMPGAELEGLVLRLRPRVGLAVVRRYPFTAPERGHYRLDGVTAETGDPLGFAAYRDAVPGAAELLVYPRLVDLRQEPRTAELLAELERPSLLEDPTLYAGVRPYLPEDPLKRIHWPQTARSGQLMSRLYPPSTRLSVWLVLNLATEEPHWVGVDREAVERAISRTASFARALLADGVPTGLVVNGVAFEATPITRLSPGASAQQFPTLMELLARMAPYPSAGGDVLLREAAHLAGSSTLLVVSPVVLPSWTVLLSSLAAERPVHLDLPPGVAFADTPGIAVSQSVGSWRPAAGAGRIGA